MKITNIAFHFQKKEDVLISAAGTLGKTVVYNGEDAFFQDSNIVWIDNDESKILNDYLLYFYKTNPWIKTHGSTIERLYNDNIRNITISYPEDIEEQKQIIKVLKEIDQKIENNKQISAELENLAKTVYDYWFLQFEFPNEEGKPYKSSGGKMVYNEELKREIPEGWEVKRLKDLLSINKEEFTGTNAKTIDLSVMPSDSISLCELNNSDNFETNLFTMNKGDILFGSIRPYLHKAGIAPCDGAVAGTVHSFKPFDKNDYNFCLITICHKNMFDYAVNNSKGTKMPVIDTDRLLEYPIPYSEKIITEFNKIDICNTICHNVMENNQLASLRDWLLPMLMNGQISFVEK